LLATEISSTKSLLSEKLVSEYLLDIDIELVLLAIEMTHKLERKNLYLHSPRNVCLYDMHNSHLTRVHLRHLGRLDES
jgi:hypothetical protein